MFQVVNLKEYLLSVEDAVALVDFEIDQAKSCGLRAVKFIHGYGSHGKGGVIAKQLHIHFAQLKRSKKIKDFVLGANFNLNHKPTLELLYYCPDCAQDSDLNCVNPGMTIVVI